MAKVLWVGETSIDYNNC